MNQQQKLDAIMFIRPKAEFVLRGLDVEWLDKKQSEPTEEEIAKGLIDFEAKQASDKIEAEAKKQILLDKLGITEEEAKLLLS